MTRLPHILGAVVLIVVVVVGVFAGGFLLGKRYQEGQYELAKDLAPLRADELLKNGDIDAAIQVLHFSKSFETIQGDQDALLGKAYLLKGDACLGKDFLASGLRYMESKNLKELSMYAKTKTEFETALAECSRQESAQRQK